MRIAITGATGFLGKALASRLNEQGHVLHLLSRSGGEVSGPNRAFRWDAMAGEPPEESLQDVDAVVHLVGENVAQRWSTEVKQRIRDSRVLGTQRLVQALSTLSRRPEVLVSASAIGYYGNRGDELLTEESGPGRDFLSTVCEEWERSADLATALGIRVVKARIGIVLGPEGGALKQMLPPFRAGLAGRLGSGKQWMSWIHRDDLLNLFLHVLENRTIAGAVNATSPNPVTNAVFTEQLAKTIHRPAVV
ncbi:MAG: TIGR01777 family protein, partial [Bryobacteraceae bacterium]|nr:TIGR01777 family protein [Bryobacteraceae bacterium]